VQYRLGAQALVGRFSGSGADLPVRLSVSFANANMDRSAALTASQLWNAVATSGSGTTTLG